MSNGRRKNCYPVKVNGKVHTYMKSPFEIRTELLYMAQNYYNEQARLQAEYLKNATSLTVDQIDKYKTLYSVDEWLQLANRLNGFVSSK